MNTMNTEMTFPHTYESGITVIRFSSRGAALITDGLNVTWIQGGWLREDGTLTPRGMKALVESELSCDVFEVQQQERQQKWLKEKEERKRAWEEKKKEGQVSVTYVLEKGVLLSGSTTAYKYACGRGYDMYHRIATRWVYIPKSQVSVERKNNKVYVTLPKWLAQQHEYIFKVLA